MNELKEKIINNPNVIAMYDYGSSVYGTSHANSDKDVIVVANNLDDDFFKSLLDKFDVSLHTPEKFQALIHEHEISVLECLWLEQKNIYKQHDWDFVLDKAQLRQACSAKSSNSWVKAKKKFVVEKDFNDYIGKKSAWHAIRILDFATQIATHGKIENYASCNTLLPQIMQCTSWEEIDSKFRTTYNGKSSEFKLVAPKASSLKM